MGAGGSVATQNLILYGLSAKTKFEKPELISLHAKFKELAAKQGNPNTITVDEMKEGLAAVGIDESDASLLQRVFAQMDSADDGQVNFKEFVTGCSLMLSGTVSERLDFSFSLYDIDGTRQIKKTEMSEVLSAINSTASWFGDPTLTKDEIAELVETVFTAHDTDKTGTLSYGQYMEAIVANPILVSFISGNGKEAAVAAKIDVSVTDEIPAPSAPAEGAPADPAPAPAPAADSQPS